MRDYQKPEIEIIKFRMTDVISSSTPSEDPDTDEDLPIPDTDEDLP